MGRRRQLPPEQLGYEAGYREGVIATHAAAIKRAVTAVLAAETSQVVSNILSNGPEWVLKALGRILGPKILRRWRETLQSVLAPVMEDAAASQEPVLGVGFDLDREFMRRYFDEYTDKIAKEIVDGSRNAVRRVLEEAAEQGLGVAQTADLVRERLAEASPQRAERIARTELQRAANGALYLQVAESGFYATKTHVHQGDDRVRDEHHFTETVGIKERYQNGEYFAGELSVNCRCKDEYQLNV